MLSRPFQRITLQELRYSHRGREKSVNDYNCVSVSEVNEYIKNILSADENLTGLFIRGEISILNIT